MAFEHPALEPRDSFNESLADNVHPTSWENPSPSGRYNLVVIGAGTAGLVSAAGAAGLGAKVALVERSLMGGDCLNVGCVPSKGVISAARIAATIRRGSEFGMNGVDQIEVDFATVMQRMRRLRAGISPHDSAERFRKLGVDVFLGQAKFIDAETVEVDGRKLRFSRAVIATGGRASAPEIPGLSEVPYLTNETVFSLTSLPKRLGVIGAGPIGAELAQAFQRLGSQVELIASNSGILPKDDREAGDIVKAALEQDGVSVHHSARNLNVSRDGDAIRLTDTKDGGDVLVDQLLVAAGRAPNIEDLDLEAGGVAYDRTGVQVDDRLRTTNPKVFAAGDVCSQYKFTHAADFMARIVIQNALFMGRAKASKLLIPWATYTSPEVAQIGLTVEQAAKEGRAVDVYNQPFDGVDRAILDGETDGFARILCDKGKGKIVGATIVGPHAGDMIGALSIAMNNGVSLGSIASAIHPYPTQAEAIRKLGDQFNRTRLTPFVKGLMTRWLSWRR